MQETITLAFLGDVMLGRGVNEEILYRSPESFWGSVLPILQGADAAIANLECAITHQSSEECCRTAKVFHFRADPAAVKVLRAGNIQFVSLANNHTLDFGDRGLLDTLHHLDAVGIRHAGAGRNLHEAATPILLDINALKVGIIALTDNEPAFAAASDRPGTRYLPIRSDRVTLLLIETAVEQLRAAGASLVVLSVHWGPNMVTAPTPQFRQFARAVVDCGVDLIHGHSAHLFQGMECYKRGLILYDTGDFLDDYAVDPVLRNDRSFVFLVEANALGLQRLRTIPVRLHYAQVDLAKDEEFAAICQRMRSLCTAFNTHVKQTLEGLEVSLPRSLEVTANSMNLNRS
ncbi:CapA family protein [Chroococcidiopsis sp.]|uniref:CapA family protein n=1 Tax=Chroococcidiopsis sp. TaxID=3088168 RepID=UPI003F3A8A74